MDWEAVSVGNFYFIAFRKIKLIRLIAAIILPLTANTQDYLGYGNSFYAGIVGACYNPASLADNVYCVDILLCGMGINIANNYVGVKRKDIGPDFNTSNLYLREYKSKKTFFLRNEILLPAFMISNARYGWGIDLKLRTYMNIDGVDRPLAHALATDFRDPGLFLQMQNTKHIGITQMSWFEIGGTYARTVYSGNQQFVAMGARPKLLFGLSSAYIFMNGGEYQFVNDDYISLRDVQVDFAHSDNFSFAENYQPTYHARFNPGIGIDLGIIYEYRPDGIQPDPDEHEDPWPGFRDRAVYKYRIGAAITDLGAIRFRSGQFSDSYNASSTAWEIRGQVFDSTSPPTLYQNFREMKPGRKTGDLFFMRTPLAFHADFDYRVTENIFINAKSFSALYSRNNNGKKVHELTRLSITPRWESQWFGIWAPVSFSRMGLLSFGLGVRVGPIIIGTDDLPNLFMRNKKFYSQDIYFAIKIPLFTFPRLKTRCETPIDDCSDFPENKVR
jgi:hypothetical protein